ncbi:MAG: glutamate-5-semialdehyde dehydrogenase [Chthoniobacterales bacterium]
MSDLTKQIHDIGAKAREASRALARLSRQDKDRALTAMADELESNPHKILEANARDIEQAEKNGLSAPMVDRLRLNADRLKSMAKGIREVVGLTDPVAEVIREWTRPNGLRITKIRTPIGVVGIIYESRPNVTADAAVLCIKTGNATILRGGSESFHSNLAIAEALQQGGAKAGLPENSVQLIPVTDREAVKIMSQMDAFIDVIVPRGGHALIEAVVSNARMPVIKHFHGVCIIYVDKDADFDMAEQIVINAKCQRPGVCNAMETLLVHEEVAPEFLKKLATALEANKVELRGDEATRKILGAGIKAATDEDWTTEYLDLIMAVRVVSDQEAAVTHINRYGSHHSDAIITKDTQAAESFLNEVDSATVYWNASTRFTDGAEFGFGAEIGISTDKLHARGPMALEELTTYKYVIRGEGQIR